MKVDQAQEEGRDPMCTVITDPTPPSPDPPLLPTPSLPYFAHPSLVLHSLLSSTPPPSTSLFQLISSSGHPASVSTQWRQPAHVHWSSPLVYIHSSGINPLLVQCTGVYFRALCGFGLEDLINYFPHIWNNNISWFRNLIKKGEDWTLIVQNK